MTMNVSIDSVPINESVDENTLSLNSGKKRKYKTNIDNTLASKEDVKIENAIRSINEFIQMKNFEMIHKTLNAYTSYDVEFLMLLANRLKLKLNISTNARRITKHDVIQAIIACLQ
jgi:hypothetical protein